jgi:hypothetical protein
MPGEQRSLRQRQRAHRAGEVEVRGRAEAVRAVAVVGDVQVAQQDLVLADLALEGHRVARLAQLALEGDLGGGVALRVGLRRREQRVLHVLLRERRTALLDLPGQAVAHGGAHAALHVDAAVVVEAAVLDRHDRALHVRGHVGQPVDPHAVLEVEPGDERAVGGEHPAALRERLDLELGGQDEVVVEAVLDGQAAAGDRPAAPRRRAPRPAPGSAAAPAPFDRHHAAASPSAPPGRDGHGGRSHLESLPARTGSGVSAA